MLSLRRLLVTSTLAVSLLFALCRSSSAFVYVEHQALGKYAYRLACQEIYAELARTKSKDPDLHMRVDIACGYADTDALMFGQIAALSGDHITDADLGNIGASKQARNILGELMKALKNADHFHPEAPRVWSRFHRWALWHASLAHKASSYLEARREFETSIAFAGYAAHFLQDSFASGHGGVNRPASSPVAALQYHHYWNGEGRLLRDGAGRVWVTFGDDRLCKDAHDAYHVEVCVRDVAFGPPPPPPPSQPNLTCEEAADTRNDNIRQVLLATKAAVIDVILTFANGGTSNYRQMELRDRIPLQSVACAAEKLLVPPMASAGLPQCAIRFDSKLEAVCTRRYRAWRDGSKIKNADVFLPCAHGSTSNCWNLRVIQKHASESYSFDAGMGFSETLGSPRERAWSIRLAPTLHATLQDLNLLNVRFEAGWYHEIGDVDGILTSAALSIPTGFGYGSVLAPEIILGRAAIFTPVRGEEMVQRTWIGGGLGLEAEFGPFGLMGSVTASGVRSRGVSAAVYGRHWDFGLDASVGLVMVPGFLGKETVRGGGPNAPPPF